MKSLLKQFIIRVILRREASTQQRQEFSRYRIAKGFRELRIILFRYAKDAILLLAGIASAAFGLESFLLPNQFIDGGITGISLLLTEVTAFPLAVLVAALNIPFVLLGFRVVSLEFAIKTALAIGGLAICIATVHFPEITHDKLLVAVFGGFFLGAGIGLSIRGGAVIDGTEVLAIFLSRKLHTTIGDFIIAFNVVIFSVAAYLLSIEQALYSLITYIAASKTLDFVVEGIEEYMGVTVISSHSEDIRQMIINELGRGVTVYKGKGGYGKRGDTRDIDIVYTVVTRLEISKLNTEIIKIDPNAFVVTSLVKDTKGGMIKRRPLAH
ncbi:MAG: YitT family protein [Spirosomataceae bacterium]